MERKYFVRRIPEWTEVSKEEYQAAAEEAGYGRDPDFAPPTAFSNRRVEGRTSLPVKLRKEQEQADEPSH